MSYYDRQNNHDPLCFPVARVAVAQSSSLSLFTNRDAELEQRAMLLKRLAFTIYSSEVDQYQKYLPDIQGKHCTHTAHIHGIQATLSIASTEAFLLHCTTRIEKKKRIVNYLTQFISLSVKPLF